MRKTCLMLATAVDKRSNFKESCETAQRQKSDHQGLFGKGKVTASLIPAKHSICRQSPSGTASEHGAEGAAGGVTGVHSKRRIRQPQRIYFERGRGADYTRGPIRIISASDGVNNACAVLLLDLKFSDSISKAIEAQRKLDDEIRETQKGIAGKA
ncbi:hypothetical protein MBLNU13_g00573t1 [Cladosporium sp. NU13]